MTIDPRHKSHNLLDGPGRAPARAMLKAVGFTAADLERPLIGAASMGSQPVGASQDVNADQVHLSPHVRVRCAWVRAGQRVRTSVR